METFSSGSLTPRVVSKLSVFQTEDINNSLDADLEPVNMEIDSDEESTHFGFKLDITKTYLTKDEKGTALPKSSTSNDAYSEGDSPDPKTRIRNDPRLRKKILKTCNMKKTLEQDSKSDKSVGLECNEFPKENKMTLGEYKKKLAERKPVIIQMKNPLSEWQVVDK